MRADRGDLSEEVTFKAEIRRMRRDQPCKYWRAHWGPGSGNSKYKEQRWGTLGGLELLR